MFLSSSQATDYEWTGVGSSCGDLLRSCVNNAADGDAIIIKTNQVIDETLFPTDSSVSLIAGDGFSPTFGAGQNIHLENRSHATRVKGMTMIDGGITIDNRASAITDALIEISGNNITQSSSSGIYVRQFAVGQALDIDVKFNHINISGDLHAAIQLFIPASGDYSWNANIYGNTVKLNEGTWGVFINNGNGLGDLYNMISANIIEGVGRSGIEIQNKLNSQAKVTSYLISNYLRGSMIRALSRLSSIGEMNVFLYNNTLIDTPSGISIEGLNGDTPLEFHLINNLIVDAEIGVSVGYPLYNNMLTNETNMFQRVDSHNGYTVSGSNITVADHIAVVQSGLTPRLVAGSPAIDAATFVTAGSYVDADGLYRSKLGGIDIGAFEYGDTAFVHTATGGSYNTQMSHSAINGLSSSESIHITQNATQPVGDFSLFNDANAGIWYSGGIGRWNIFNQDTMTEIENGVNFNVIQVGDSANTFEHVASGGTFSFTLLDVSQLNDDPNKILQVSQHWTGFYNDHPEGIYYNEIFDKWYIYNLDNAPIPDGANYNVYYQDSSKSAWQHTATLDNSGTTHTILDNPLINGVPCAQIQVTQKAVNDAFNGHSVAVQYNRDIEKWLILQQQENGGIVSVPALPTGAQFHVLINPQQIEQCKDVIFANSFD